MTCPGPITPSCLGFLTTGELKETLCGQFHVPAQPDHDVTGDRLELLAAEP